MEEAKQQFSQEMKLGFAQSDKLKKFMGAAAQVSSDDGCLIIYTTGTTGVPKPALISQKNITAQSLCMVMAFSATPEDKVLVNLPPSHVGCVTEQLGVGVFGGLTVCLLHIFDPVKSLQAIQKYKVTIVGQIPALYEMEWRLPDYGKYDLSSLRIAIYGGQQVSVPFLEKLLKMAPQAATGLGLTETAGFCTYLVTNSKLDEIKNSIGSDMPVTPITIRKPIKEDLSAGDEVPAGEIGEICFSGPQIFKGYYNNQEATAKTKSKDGILYTGDLGLINKHKQLEIVGRSKLVIKPKGYQVYPPEIENHIMQKLKDLVTNVAVVGEKHEIFSEAIVAFVEKKKDAQLAVQDVNKSCLDIAAYQRPSLVILLEPG